MKKSDFTRFVDKTMERLFDGLGILMMIVVGVMVIFLACILISAMPYFVMAMVIFFVLAYVIGYAREGVSRGYYDDELGSWITNPKSKIKKIKRWEMEITTKLKSVTTLYFKPLKDMWSLTKIYLKK